MLNSPLQGLYHPPSHQQWERVPHSLASTMWCQAFKVFANPREEKWYRSVILFAFFSLQVKSRQFHVTKDHFFLLLVCAFNSLFYWGFGHFSPFMSFFKYIKDNTFLFVIYCDANILPQLSFVMWLFPWKKNFGFYIVTFIF